jgi:signal transduction histidine kinase
MHTNIENNTDKYHPAFSNFAFDLLEDILESTDQPAKMNRLLAEQLRVITGAQLVVLARQRDYKKTETASEIIAFEPHRRQKIAKSYLMIKLAEMTSYLDGPTLWRYEQSPPEIALLLGEDKSDSTIAVPLRVGTKTVGALLLFGLPEDKTNLDQILDVLSTLSRVVALALRNAALFEDQEIIIADRTRELAEAENNLRKYAELLEEKVTERTKELQETQELLIRKERLAVLGELAGEVGHELRTPLGVISNSIYYLKMLIPESETDIYLSLNLIENSTNDASQIVSDLLDFARIKSMDRLPIQISALISDVINLHQPPDNVDVKVELQSDLDEVFAVPLQIKQVIANLVTNAYQAMPDGGTLTIKKCASPPDDSVSKTIKLCLQDTGTGIPPDHLEKIFEPLFTTKDSGIGLGLAITRKLVEANDGNIQVKSTEGEGTTFSVTLPIYGGEA